MTRYCVIGAGAAGISALQQLREAGFEVDCFEKTDRVGGHWHTDYDALHLITSRDMTGFDGFPMPADYPHFPRRDLVTSFIESYARHHGHYDLIRFGTEIVSVAPVPCDGPTGSVGWHVTSSAGDEGTYDGVLIANGHLWAQHVPEVPGEYTGYQVHSGSYRNVDELAPGRTLVVGVGNSGCDIAVDIAQHRLDVDIVVRKGVLFQAKTYFGVPRAEVPLLAGLSPDEIDVTSRMLAKVALGDNSSYPGLPAAEATTLADGPVTVNDLLLYWIHHGRVAVRPGIERVDGRTVHFADGTSGDYGSIVWATGFDVRLPFLADDVITWRDGVPVRYAGGMLPEGAEKLYFIGLIAPRGPQIPVYGEQAKRVARMIAAHEKAGPTGLPLAARFSEEQEPELRVDIVRAVWNEQMQHTDDLLDTL